MTKKKNKEVLSHYEQTLGNIPDPIRVLFDYDPISLLGYTTMRKSIMKEPPEGALPIKINELIFVLLDCMAGNIEGAKNHTRAAVKAGLTTRELMEALIQVIMVTGIASWGMTGYKVIEFAEAISREDA